jgi:hypothetical protein
MGLPMCHLQFGLGLRPPRLGAPGHGLTKSSPYRFLADSEFALLDADAKSHYIVEATKAVAALADEIRAHVRRRDDEIEGGRTK